MNACFFTFVAIVAVVAIVIHHTAKRRAQDETWQEVARTLGLEFRGGGIGKTSTLSGTFGGDRVTVRRETRGGGQYQHAVTAYRYAYRGGPQVAFELRAQGFFHGLKKLLGSQDIEVGDRRFDDAVIVKGSHARRVVGYLTPERRVRIRGMLIAHDGCVITNRTIHLERRGVDDGARIQATLQRLRALAQILREPVADRRDDRRAEPPPIDRAIAAMREGRFDRAEAMLREAKKTGASRIEVEVLERELRGEPEPVERAVPEPAPAPVSEPRPAEPEPEQPAAAEAPRAPLDDPAAVCEALFAPSRTDADAHRLFDDEYDGRRVRWTGTLRRLEPYGHDRVFGDVRGTRATFDVAEIGGEFAFARTIQAIVQLPEAAAEELRSEIGSEVAFEGRLVRCDPFVRNLFVAEAAADPAA